MTIKRDNRGFTLIELLSVISISAVLMGILMPCLSRARDQARTVSCLSSVRQIGLSFVMYAAENNGYTMPNYDPDTDTYWWGQKRSEGIDHTKGFVWPYLHSELRDKSVYECPGQRLGTYTLQGKPAGEPDDPKWITSTYGYNGYYLCPPRSPWAEIRHRPWQKTSTVDRPGKVIAFGDAMLDWDVSREVARLSNNAMIDPPFILSPDGSHWVENLCPTTSFRHNDRANIFFVDGHCSSMKVEDGGYTSPEAKIGSISANNSPYYVPDFESWPTGRRRRR